jgi:7-cyano-7-deazaguanine synthase
MRTVLLSGGLDSAAALHFAKERGGEVHALGFDYGQPHRGAELAWAKRIAKRRGVPFEVIVLPPKWQLDPTAGSEFSGISRAFVPMRNARFLIEAAAHVATPGEDVVLVIGANGDDIAGFPDCRPRFFEAAAEMMRAALDGMCKVRIETPWLCAPKAGILRWALSRPEALEDIRDSVSCYRGTRCGICDACTLRARVFAEVGIEDGKPA